MLERFYLAIIFTAIIDCGKHLIRTLELDKLKILLYPMPSNEYPAKLRNKKRRGGK
jgi:hypothetical protein